MLDNGRVKALVESLSRALVSSSGKPLDEAEGQAVTDVTELAVGLLQAFNDISYQLSEIVDRMDRMRP
jgi:hypothetical protein